MKFDPTLKSLHQHTIPDWYHDAKLGIFIHWGLYSVPGWAPLSGDISKVDEGQGWQDWFKNNSYAEWYLNSLKFEDGPTREFHTDTYGEDFAYDDFALLFNDAVQKWDPQDWAELFKKVGARYVVLTSKHHDGFTLWPTEQPCPHKPDYHTTRDLVGELTDAVREKDMHMGIYYSGGLDWSFNESRIESIVEVWSTIVQDPKFIEYSVGHWRELIDRYQPTIMWNDIGFPAAANLPELFAYYYNNVPGGVINDRFSQLEPNQSLGEGGPSSIPRGPHYDYVTPEYSSFDEIQDGKWETVRGIGHSFGYSRNEGDDQLLSFTELIHMFVDVVSKNGNLLLNVGPMADGTIPANQRERLENLGEWLDINGEAIFGTRPWVKADGQTTGGLGVRFTRKDDALYATILGTPADSQLCLQNLTVEPNVTVQLLGRDGNLEWQQDGSDLAVTLPGNLPQMPAHSLKITPLSGVNISG